jgi:hypothetical protein
MRHKNSTTGTLYAGDGVVIQQPEDIKSDVDHGCIAILRYPRSTFASTGIVTLYVFCVELIFCSSSYSFLCCSTFSLWARTQSTSARRFRRSAYYASDVFQPDVQFVNSQNEIITEYGRLNIHFLANGSIVHNIQPEQGTVSENEVIINIRLTFVDALTVYAVRRFKVQPFQTHATARLAPMQPTSRRTAVVYGYYSNKPKPLDFTCSEFDLSALPNGMIFYNPLMFRYVNAFRYALDADCCLFRRH